jgi:single-strand DNA-binding protein
MRINQWVNGERSGTTVEIDAYNVGHDLSRGQAKFTKVAKPQLNQSDRMADPEVQDAAEQLDRDAAMADHEVLEGDDEPVADDSPDAAGRGIELEAADTDEYETVGAGSR